MTARITTKTTQMYSNAGPRSKLDPGVIIDGWQVGDRWYCSNPVVVGGITIMKVGWWVMFADTAAYTAPPPEPTIHLTHTVEVYSDGSIRVDGSFIAA